MWRIEIAKSFENRLTRSNYCQFISFCWNSSLGHSTFGHSSINLYNNYASTPYATYTAPQYTTANPNRCPPNANIKPSTAAGGSEHREYDATIRTTNKQSSAFKYVLRKTKFDNGSSTGAGDITVVANNTSHATNNTKNERKRYNETVIEEGHNNRLVSINKIRLLILKQLPRNFSPFNCDCFCG